jgi:hypothetical protein
VPSDPTDPLDPLAPLLDLSGVVDTVAASRRSVDALLGHRVLRRRSNEVSAASALHGVWAAAVISGADLTLEELQSGEDRAVSDPVVQGALRVSTELGALADTWTLAPRQVLARLHVLAAADLGVTPEALGRPAGGPDVAARIDLLSQTLSATTAPAVVVAAVVAGEILALDAFAPASAVVALAAVRLTLVERGLDPKSLVVVEVGARERRADLAAALVGYRSGTAAGLATWIALVGDWVALGARETTAICEAMQRG